MFAADARTLSRIAPAVRRVVIVDPNPSMTRLLTDIMKGLGAREVYTESDEGRALDLIREVEPGVLFTEARGETLDGASLARRVRRSSMSCRMLPIIMVTGEATAAGIKAARDAGVHEFLRKPFTTGDLFKRVENVALKPRPWVEAVGYVGPDRRRFNSGEYSGARKRTNDAPSDNPAAEAKDQAMRILTAALGQFDSDPTQAVRAIKRQAEILKAMAIKMGDAKLAIAAAGLDGYLAGGAPTKVGLIQPIGAVVALAEPAVPMARAG